MWLPAHYTTAMDHTICCYRCGTSLAALSLPLSRQDQCPECGNYVHVCKMCTFFDVHVPKQCREDDAEEVEDTAETEADVEDAADEEEAEEEAEDDAGEDVEYEYVEEESDEFYENMTFGYWRVVERD